MKTRNYNVVLGWLSKHFFCQIITSFFNNTIILTATYLQTCLHDKLSCEPTAAHAVHVSDVSVDPTRRNHTVCSMPDATYILI